MRRFTARHKARLSERTHTTHSQTHYLNMLPLGWLFLCSLLLWESVDETQSPRERLSSHGLEGGHISQSGGGLLTANPVVCLYESMQSASNMGGAAGA